ncbi:Slam-dependent surface lipoprotein [Acinetobacter boissieri]|uniref:Factor H binding protein-like C-terminal domain-containing protein n=1 Tax=Acinetobacter boissieri TaxID=1219383 RepID=A0A1G6GK14_9GAMM|nr:Slam-dependent surface lipoprotein [Acinetobacter boissieri]SDB82284.1 hypothetical protein SAMN05421733_101299 [Acinetobacter boissieri]
MPLINTPKIVSAIIISLTMTACSSGGNHATQNVTTSPQQSDADKKAAEDKAIADKKAAEDKAIADKKAAEDKAIADKKSAEDKAIADKKAAEDKATADKKAAEDKAIADKAAEDKATADKKAAEDKAIADKAAADKAIADKKAAEDKVIADNKTAENKITVEQALAEKIATRKAWVLAENNGQAARAASADTTAAYAIIDAAVEKMILAEVNYEFVFSQFNYINALDEISKTDKNASPDAYNFARDKADTYKKLYDKATALKDAADKALIAEKIATQADEKAKAKNATAEDIENAKKANANMDIADNIMNAAAFESAAYQQSYSVVLGNYTGDLNHETNRKVPLGRTGEISIIGMKTHSNALPTLGSATYDGKAFQDLPEKVGGAWTSKINEGHLSYNVNFTERTGSGSITGLGDAITLEKGSISGTDISSTVKQADLAGNYSLGFYGKNAEEVAGKVVFTNNDSIGFGGTRGDVK